MVLVLMSAVEDGRGLDNAIMIGLSQNIYYLVTN